MLLPVIGTWACCSPLAAEPVSEAEAAGLARVFKALADPVRLRPLTLIASNDGGEACVCELAGAFDARVDAPALLGNPPIPAVAG